MICVSRPAWRKLSQREPAMIKMVVSDIDGTLMPIGGSLSARTADAIRNCVSHGVVFVLASGRTYENAASVARRMGLDCMVISANGGRIDAHSERESCIYEDRMDETTAKQVFDRLYETGCFMTSYVGTKVYALSERNRLPSKCVQTSEAKPGRPFSVNDDPERMRTEGVRGPYKFEVYSEDPAELNGLKSEFERMGLFVSGAFSYNLEIMPGGSGKGKAVRELARSLGIKKEEILALGDGSNDLTMLLEAGMPVAMENAAECLKEAAVMLAPAADRDGAAEILEQIVLSERI